jgi:hypothetical protein
MDDFNLNGVIKKVGEGSSFDKFITTVIKTTKNSTNLTDVDFELIEKSSNKIDGLVVNSLDENCIFILWENYSFELIRYGGFIAIELQTSGDEEIPFPDVDKLMGYIKSEIRNKNIDGIIGNI